VVKPGLDWDSAVEEISLQYQIAIKVFNNGKLKIKILVVSLKLIRIT
jgi:hypothetical protein